MGEIADGFVDRMCGFGSPPHWVREGRRRRREEEEAREVSTVHIDEDPGLRVTAAKRYAVTGGRDYNDLAHVFSALDRVLAKVGPFVLVTGVCGVDKTTDLSENVDLLAALWALRQGIIVHPFPADWKGQGKSAGFQRNRRMALSSLSGLVAFPGGRGTADMVRQCEEQGVTVWRPTRKEE